MDMEKTLSEIDENAQTARQLAHKAAEQFYAAMKRRKPLTEDEIRDNFAGDVRQLEKIIRIVERLHGIV